MAGECALLIHFYLPKRIFVSDDDTEVCWMTVQRQASLMLGRLRLLPWPAGGFVATTHARPRHSLQLSCLGAIAYKSACCTCYQLLSLGQVVWLCCAVVGG
jgi:hypothetical protein